MVARLNLIEAAFSMSGGLRMFRRFTLSKVCDDPPLLQGVWIILAPVRACFCRKAKRSPAATESGQVPFRFLDHLGL